MYYRDLTKDEFKSLLEELQKKIPAMYFADVKAYLEELQLIQIDNKWTSDITLDSLISDCTTKNSENKAIPQELQLPHILTPSRLSKERNKELSDSELGAIRASFEFTLSRLDENGILFKAIVKFEEKLNPLDRRVVDLFLRGEITKKQYLEYICKEAEGHESRAGKIGGASLATLAIIAIAVLFVAGFPVMSPLSAIGLTIFGLIIMAVGIRQVNKSTEKLGSSAEGMRNMIEGKNSIFSPNGQLKSSNLTDNANATRRADDDEDDEADRQSYTSR